MPLAAWVTVVAFIERLFTAPRADYQIAIDLVGADVELLRPERYIAIQRGDARAAEGVTATELVLARRAYAVGGFLEALGTSSVLNRPDRAARVYYPWFPKGKADLAAFYAGQDDHTVVLPITRIDSKDHCRQFLDDTQIANWRQEMASRFEDSPLFEAEELWRVLCHELAVNIFEHSGASGFVAARVVQPKRPDRTTKWWCRTGYDRSFQGFVDRCEGPFLELCVSDAGRGIVDTLRAAYATRHQLSSPSEADNQAVVAYAFDAFGTCKHASDTWLSERHALNRILRITQKYGGLLRVLSGTVHGLYDALASRTPSAKRLPSIYDPIWSFQLPPLNGAGTHLQILLPLVPLLDNRPVDRGSVFGKVLPDSYATQSGQPIGHLVPLRERLRKSYAAAVGAAEQRSFRHACIQLVDDLASTRPQTEAFVFDFSSLNWSEAQFETFLHLIQNLILTRPILLVEIPVALARRVAQLERENAPTMLSGAAIPESKSVTGNVFGEVSERRYLETLSGIHAGVLGIDIVGRPHVFGLLAPEYEEPLLALISQPKSLRSLVETFPAARSADGQAPKDHKSRSATLRALLKGSPHLFVNTRLGWTTVWTRDGIETQATRSMNRHFDQVLRRSRAWLGHGQKVSSRGRQVFYVPAARAWRTDFLDTDRVLARGRHADEVAQRLIFRLEMLCTSQGRALDSIQALAAATGPALLLATALYRWWPRPQRPGVLDLSELMSSGPSDEIPWVSDGHVVIVQDVLDTGSSTTALVTTLRSGGVTVASVVAMVRFVRSLAKSRVTAFNMKESIGPADAAIDAHWLLEAQRPDAAPPLTKTEPDDNAYWIEPRSLKAVSYPALRRRSTPATDSDLDVSNEFVALFDDNPKGCLFQAGHFVYGARHYAVAVDHRRGLLGTIGDRFATWIADLCEGRSDVLPSEQQSAHRTAVSGDVSAVLMPLHSQVHYLWPKVERLLSQRGRRQPMWLLEARLSARGPSYLIPEQLQLQLADAMKRRQRAGGLRILIIDDAIASGRTLETIIASLLTTLDELEPINEQARANAIEWVRYCVAVNQMEPARYRLFRDIGTMGTGKWPLVIDALAPFMGVAVYDRRTCPMCQTRQRWRALETTSKHTLADHTTQWVKERLAETRPRVLGASDAAAAQTRRLPEPIDVLAPRADAQKSHLYLPRHADTAIWRFHELMYLSYPPSDVLRSLKYARSDSGAYEPEYERYRWTVLDWCMQNWPRVVADGAVEDFLATCTQEVQWNSPLCERILEGLARLHRDADVRAWIARQLALLRDLEIRPRPTDDDERTDLDQRRLRLSDSITLFALSVGADAVAAIAVDDARGDQHTFLAYLDQLISSVPHQPFSFLRLLRRTLSHAGRYADPAVALESLAEVLFRGRDPDQPAKASHLLLPRLIVETLRGRTDVVRMRRLQTALCHFAAALADLSEYADIFGDVRRVVDAVRTSFELKPSGRVFGAVKSPALRQLNRMLVPTSPFMSTVSTVFHESVATLVAHLEQAAERHASSSFIVECIVDNATRRARVLTHVEQLNIMLANLAVDPAQHAPTGRRSRILVSPGSAASVDRLSFRILTNFATFAETKKRIIEGRSSRVDYHLLRTFGARCDMEPASPTAEESDQGFTAAFTLDVMAGFVPREAQGQAQLPLS